MYTKKSLTLVSGLGVLTIGLLCASIGRADPAPGEITPFKARDIYAGGTRPSTGAEEETEEEVVETVPSTGYTRSIAPSIPVYDEPAASRPHRIVYRSEPPRSVVNSFDRSVDAQEAAMLVACSLERRPYGRAFMDGRVASNWRWSEVRRDARREIEFSQKRHGSSPFENPMCELFMLKRMLEQGGNASLTYRCELVRDDLYRSFANIQSGGASSSASFGLLDSIMGSRSAENSESICRSPNSDEIFACATEDLGSHLGNSSLQRKAAENVLNLCRARGANMNSSVGYFNAGLIPSGGGFCGPTGGGFGGFGGGVAVIQSQEPWYKTVLSAGLGFAKILGPLKVLSDGHKMREETSQLAINRNADLGFPSVVQGAGTWGGGGGLNGCGGYGTCTGGGGGFYAGGSGCGMPPMMACGSGGGGYYGGGGGGYGGVAGYPGYGGGHPGFGGGGGGGLPGPWGTAGGTNGWSPGFGGGGMGNNPWGAGGQYGGPSYWGTNYNNGYAGANNGFFQDSFNAQQARAQNRSNRYGSLYDNLGSDSRSNAGNLWDTTNSFSSGYNGGYQYYPPYSPTPTPY